MKSSRLDNLVASLLFWAIAAGVWFCVDDTLAELFNWPALGELGYWTVLAIMWLWNKVVMCKVNVNT